MRPSIQLGHHPRVGVEIEISRWKEQEFDENGYLAGDWNYVRNMKTSLLVNEGMMPASPANGQPYHTKFHQYNCTCTDCKMWENHDTSPYPVQFALKYDGTLPLTGGEYISSPFAITQLNWQSFFKGWSLLTETAVLDRQIKNKQGNKSSPSVHVHASCQNEDYDLHLAEQFRAVFAPEIWVLALAADVDHRGSQYCKITGLDDHHSYMNLRHMRALTEDGKPKIKAGQYFWDGPHIEIRTWEGDYNNPQYIEGAVHCTAAIAQLMSSKMIARKLIGLSMLRRNSFTKETVNIGASMNVDNIISMVDPDVLAVLQHAMTTVTYAGQDDVAAMAIDWMFARTKERLGL